jgi:molybdopterin molybdotransferase
MVSVAEARKIIAESIMKLPPVKTNLRDAAGQLLATDVYASADIPAFPQSSMDGYAFSFDGWKQHQRLKLAGEVPAGDTVDKTLEEGKAIRIFTGAAVPSGADTVIMQEKVRLEKDELIPEDSNLKPGANVRPKGSEIQAGELALTAGVLLTPAAIGFLAGIGITEVTIFPHPAVTVIITGRELQQPELPLQHGQVYESNSFALKAALEQLHMSNVQVVYADDDLSVLTGILATALQQSDIVLLTGGISAGDYDFVLQAAEACGVTKKFHKVKQRPGKPFYFGMKAQKPVFGLPGNPSSVLTCFYEYVIPALYRMSNREKSLQARKAVLAKAIQKMPGLTHFMKGYYDGQTVMPLNAQESYRMSSFAKANCLVIVEEDITNCKEGEEIEIHLLS